MKDQAGWFRNNSWEPWCLVVPRASEAGDAIHAMRAMESAAIKRGSNPTLLAIPVGEVPAQPLTRKKIAKFRSQS